MVKAPFRFGHRTVFRRQAFAHEQAAVNNDADGIARLSEAERIRMLATLEAIVSRKPTRTPADVDRELRAIRTARRRQ